MTEQFPVHIMVKPEGLEYFPDYIHDQIQTLESKHGSGINFTLRTVLTPQEVEMIYPGSSAPEIFKQYLVEHESEHIFFLGDDSVYEGASAMKGKYDQKTGIRGATSERAQSMGLQLEPWQNFIHTSENAEEVRSICQHLMTNPEICNFCSEKSICRSTT